LAVVSSTLADPSASAPPDAVGRRRKRRNPLQGAKAKTGAVILGIFAILAVAGPWLAPDDPEAVGPAILQGPSGSHLLGTTQTGQDVLSQLLVSARSSMEVGILAAVISTALAVAVGVTAGYLGGVTDEILSMVSNIFLVIPAIPLIIVLVGLLGHGGTFAIALIISLTGWAFGARILRAQTLSLRGRDYVLAAKATGEKSWRIVLFELMPNLGAIVATSFLLTMLFAILAQTSLSFLGLGNVGDWSWGTMLYWAQQDEALNVGAWWWFIPPGLCVALVGMGLSLLNFSVDEIVNPRLSAANKSKDEEDGE
jgi:peptide/nickel transport system permease protein